MLVTDWLKMEGPWPELFAKLETENVCTSGGNEDPENEYAQLFKNARQTR